MAQRRSDALRAAQRRAEQLDAEDPLAGCRERFAEPAPRAGRDTVYLCGNSLGLMPKEAATELARVLDDWRRLGVRGHFEGEPAWLDYHAAAREPLAALAGAKVSEVVAMNSLTVNLHLLLASFYRPAPERDAILVEAGAFPSDRYAAQSQLRWHGVDSARLIEWPAGPDGLLHLDTLDELLAEHGDRIALALLPGVQYATGQWLPLDAVTALCRRHGIVTGIDLAHAIGNVPLRLHDDAVDFAVWCSYKYLNSGPGAVAGAFVHERHHGRSDLPRLDGWWGNRVETRFEMREHIDAAAGADAWQLSNPPVLALAPVVASLRVFDEAGITQLRQKSLALTGFLAELLAAHFAAEITILSPSDPAARGCQLSLRASAGAETARRLFAALDAMNVVGDWREPDIMRFAPTPLYNRFRDVVVFCQRLDQALGGLGS